METIVFTLLVLLCSTPLKANEACGSHFDGILVTYRCPVEHHCCDSQISTCCPEFFICIENIAIVIVPIVVSVLIVSFCILCLICCFRTMNNPKPKPRTDSETNADTQNTQQIQVIDEQYLSTKL